ncbi:hypothetical protein KC867_03815, partial [Candidatus Saccharibacteria bacterium]|nr:hypothetical protein [Candidatus Saccharibacteria bacterium]
MKYIMSDFIKANKFIASILVLASSVFITQTVLVKTASAAYEAGRILDNDVLLDAGSMNAGQIQSFLNN